MSKYVLFYGSQVVFANERPRIKPSGFPVEMRQVCLIGATAELHALFPDRPGMPIPLGLIRAIEESKIAHPGFIIHPEGQLYFGIVLRRGVSPHNIAMKYCGYTEHNATPRPHDYWDARACMSREAPEKVRSLLRVAYFALYYPPQLRIVKEK